MTTTIVKWGNSQGIRLPKVLLENVNLSENDTVEILAEHDTIVIKKSTPNKYKSIQELFEGYEGEYEPTDIDWGNPVGREIW